MSRNPLQSFFGIDINIGRDVAGKFTEAGDCAAEGFVDSEEEFRNGAPPSSLFEQEVHLTRLVAYQHSHERKWEQNEQHAHDDRKKRGDARPPAEGLGYPSV